MKQSKRITFTALLTAVLLLLCTLCSLFRITVKAYEPADPDGPGAGTSEIDVGTVGYISQTWQTGVPEDFLAHNTKGYEIYYLLDPYNLACLEEVARECLNEKYELVVFDLEMTLYENQEEELRELLIDLQDYKKEGQKYKLICAVSQEYFEYFNKKINQEEKGGPKFFDDIQNVGDFFKPIEMKDFITKTAQDIAGRYGKYVTVYVEFPFTLYCENFIDDFIEDLLEFGVSEPRILVQSGEGTEIFDIFTHNGKKGQITFAEEYKSILADNHVCAVRRVPCDGIFRQYIDLVYKDSVNQSWDPEFRSYDIIWNLTFTLHDDAEGCPVSISENDLDNAREALAAEILFG